MHVNAILMALRQLRKNPLTGLFTLGGLAIGITTFTLLLFYVRKESRYDRYHQDADQLYRIVNQYRIGTDHQTTAWISPALTTFAQEKLPEVAEMVRLFRYRSPSVIVEEQTGKSFSEESSLWADANVFRVFTFRFIKGNPAQALTRPNTMVITASAAKKYFGDADPIGRSLNDLTMGAIFEITAVVDDMPATSHFHADFLCSLSTLPKLWGETILSNWNNSFLYTYVRLANGATATATEAKLNAVLATNTSSTADASSHFSLQPVPDIHLKSHVLNEWQANSDVRYIYILTLVGILILLVSTINYVNLWIARAEQRTREIGIRKAIGSSKLQLGWQFVIESLVQVVLALILSMALAPAIGPQMESAFGEPVSWLPPANVTTWVAIGVAIALFMTIVMLYPIRIISKIQPAWAIKGTVVKLQQGFGLWQGLVAFQVLATTMLITGTLLVQRQLSFLEQTPIGYDAGHLLNIAQLSNTALREQLKNQLLQYPHVKAVSGVSHQVGGLLYQSGYTVYKKNEPEIVLWQRMHTDHDFCKTYGVPIIAGRDFSRAVASDTANFILNEAACRQLSVSPSEAVGLEIMGENNVRGKIVGVMKDFHFKTLHTAIEPLIAHIVPDRIRMLSVNIDHDDRAATLAWIAAKWKTLEPAVPFLYTALDDFNARNYSLEHRFGKLILFFTAVVFLLSVGGLISLNIYVVNLKRKEIGIRKILGADIQGVLFTLSRRFVLLTVVSAMLSVPFSWYILSAWLNGFAYRVDITPGWFVSAGVITFALSMLSIALPSIRAALKNPAEALKTE